MDFLKVTYYKLLLINRNDFLISSAGGGFYLLGVQCLTAICITFWGISITFLLLWLVNKITPLRMTPEDELLGADYTEHNIWSSAIAELIPKPTSLTTTERRSEETRISQRSSRFIQNNEDKTVGGGAFKINFTDDTRVNSSSKTPARNNPAFQLDDEFS